MARRGAQNGPDHFPLHGATAGHGLWREPGTPGTRGAHCARSGAASGGAGLEGTQLRTIFARRTLQQRQYSDRPRLQRCVDMKLRLIPKNDR